MKRSEKKEIKEMLKNVRAEAKKLQTEMKAIEDHESDEYKSLAKLFDDNISRQKEIASMLPDGFGKFMAGAQLGLHGTAVVAEIAHVIFRTDTAKAALRSVCNTFKRIK